MVIRHPYTSPRSNRKLVAPPAPKFGATSAVIGQGSAQGAHFFAEPFNCQLSAIALGRATNLLGHASGRCADNKISRAETASLGRGGNEGEGCRYDSSKVTSVHALNTAPSERNSRLAWEPNDACQSPPATRQARDGSRTGQIITANQSIHLERFFSSKSTVASVHHAAILRQLELSSFSSMQKNPA